MRCRLLPHRADDGPVNMATDEWMLESVVADPTAAALRTYGWRVPTLSLGYFQRLAEVESDPRWRGRPLVRRATGGGAIWHDRELTIAVAVPAGHPLARRSKDLYRAVHEAILGVIADRGLDAHRRGEAEARTTADRPLLCFRDRDAEDLVDRRHEGPRQRPAATGRRPAPTRLAAAGRLGDDPRTARPCRACTGPRERPARPGPGRSGNGSPRCSTSKLRSIPRPKPSVTGSSESPRRSIAMIPGRHGAEPSPTLCIGSMIC